jgi:photosystem II stability/assembly factor-like uncharacterized protein
LASACPRSKIGYARAVKIKLCVTGVLLLIATAIWPLSLSGQIFAWTPTSATSNTWTGIASSADGTKLAACFGYAGGGVYISTNTGVAWAKVNPPLVANPWQLGTGMSCIASSANGQRVVVGSGNQGYSTTNSGYIYVSTDAGQDWVQINAPWEDYSAIGLSGDGSVLAAAGHYGIWKSTNGVITSGNFFSEQFNTRGYWKNVALSTNGSFLFATDLIQLYTSTNNFVYPWYLTSAPSNQWSAIASSSDGTKLIACNDYAIGCIFTSTNSGLTWTQISAPSNTFWSAVTSSADGTKLAACSYSGNIYFSTNSGLTWSSNSFPSYVKAMAASADGTKLFAVFYGGGISVGQLIVPAQNFSANVNGSGVSLQFTGAPNCAYVLFAATNLTSPMPWQAVVTNSTDANGRWLFTDTNWNKYTQRFYIASQ